MKTADFVIVGAGMAGASLGAELAAHGSVILIEMEAQPGYHATGRSVAFWEESYGGPLVQPLTTASGAMMWNPDPELSEVPFLAPRGAIHVGPAESVGARDAMIADFAGSGVGLERLDGPALRARIPGLRDGWTVGLAEPSCADIDAAAMHQSYLRLLRRRGGQVLTGTRLVAGQREGRGWRVETSDGVIVCGTLVNAAGAWVDEVAALCSVGPIGITPFRRTVVQLRTSPAAPADLPVIMDLGGAFYFKPEGGGRIWLSPHDEEPSEPCDAAPEELAVAEAIDRFEKVVDWRIEAVERKWAGLRSFSPDRLPVYGFDPLAPGFFWFAGQGGFGIQTAPAAAKLGLALATGLECDAVVAGIDAEVYAPDRFV